MQVFMYQANISYFIHYSKYIIPDRDWIDQDLPANALHFRRELLNCLLITAQQVIFFKKKADLCISSYYCIKFSKWLCSV